MVLTLFRKAISAGKVTVMGNVQAQCLDYGLTLLKIKNVILINIGSKQLSCLLQFQDLVHRFGDLFLGIGDICKIQYSSLDGVRILDTFCHQRLYQRNHIIHNIIYHMDRTTVHIHNDIIAVALILVYHSSIPLLSTSYCLKYININYRNPIRKIILRTFLNNMPACYLLMWLLRPLALNS